MLLKFSAWMCALLAAWIGWTVLSSSLPLADLWPEIRMKLILFPLMLLVLAVPALLLEIVPAALRSWRQSSHQR